jgi:hypothetical protein
MTHAGPTWLLMIRDVSGSVVVDDQPRVVASLIVDADTGMVRGAAMAPSPEQACLDVVTAALERPIDPLPAEPPGRVVHPKDHAELVARVLEDAGLAGSAELITVAGPMGEAEEVFDSLLGHLGGRAQPDDPPAGDDWSHLYAEAARYTRAEPWRRWSDAEPFDLDVMTVDDTRRYLAVVLGQAGIQRGLAVHPQTAIPDWPGDLDDPDALDGLDDDGDGAVAAAFAASAGALLLWLDAPADAPDDLRAKAERYGWPAELTLVPLPLTTGQAGPCDLDRVGAQHLTVALAAVLDLHAREDGDLRRTMGQVQLCGESAGAYVIAPAAEPEH